MTDYKFKVGDIAKVKLQEVSDLFPVGELVVVVRVDKYSNSYKYQVARLIEAEDDYASRDWLADEHLESASKVIAGEELTYSELVEAVATGEFTEGYRVNYHARGAVDGAVKLEFNGVTFVYSGSTQPLSLDVYSATGVYELVGKAELKYTYKLPESIADAMEINYHESYLNYNEHYGTGWFNDLVECMSAQTSFTDTEFATVPEMGGLKQLLIKEEV